MRWIECRRATKWKKLQDSDHVTRVFYLGRNKSERVICSFCFYSECSFFLARCHPLSFLFSSILPFFLPSLHFIQFHLTILTRTRSYNWTRTWCTITGLIKFISGTDVFLFALHISFSLSLSSSLSFSSTFYSWSVLLRQTAKEYSCLNSLFYTHVAFSVYLKLNWRTGVWFQLQCVNGDSDTYVV